MSSNLHVEYCPQKNLHAKELDAFLAHAWFRNGQTMFHTQILCFEQGVYSPVWIRLPLTNYVPKKRLRKLLRKNSHFRTVVKKASITPAKERLYQQHKYRFSGYIHDSLSDYLEAGGASVFNTMEICVYDGRKLIAVSYFDVGDVSLAGIIALYDNSYATASLGMYTMLKEINYGVINNYQYYYPGYIVPGYAPFDYKRRIGDVEYFDWTDSMPNKPLWKPIAQMPIHLLPANIIQARLRFVQKSLQGLAIPTKMYTYPLFHLGKWGQNGKSFLQSPVFLQCYPNALNYEHLVVEYEWSSHQFSLNRYSEFETITPVCPSSFYERFANTGNWTQLLLHEKSIACHTKASDLVHDIIQATN